MTAASRPAATFEATRKRQTSTSRPHASPLIPDKAVSGQAQYAGLPEFKSHLVSMATRKNIDAIFMGSPPVALGVSISDFGKDKFLDIFCRAYLSRPACGKLSNQVVLPPTIAQQQLHWFVAALSSSMQFASAVMLSIC